MKIVERVTLHVSDDTGRIAMLENRTYGTAANDNNTAATLTRYIYSNHLQSASLELDENSLIISYEEYHPYGTTSYQAMNASIQAVAKRYRFTGKERDEESGLYYHGARYYISWLCRWVSVDPLESKYAGMSSYNYSFNNPVVWNDPSGMGPEDGKVNVQFGDQTYNVEANYFPSGRFSEMESLGEFPYRWQDDGQMVVNYHDDSTDKDYSVLESRSGDGTKFYSSWVNIKTGEAEVFTGYENFKDYRWLGFDTYEEREASAEALRNQQILKDGLRTTASFIPFVGGGLDIYEGARDGKWGQVALDTFSLALDIFGGTIIKAGAKAFFRAGVKEGAEIASKEIVETVTKKIGEESIEITTKQITNSAGDVVTKQLVNSEDDLLKIAEDAAGGSLDNFKEIKPNWWKGEINGVKRRVEWQPGGEAHMNEGPHVKIMDWDHTKGRKGGFRTSEKYFINGKETFY